jgi:hypothetical protein
MGGQGLQNSLEGGNCCTDLADYDAGSVVGNDCGVLQ